MTTASSDASNATLLPCPDTPTSMPYSNERPLIYLPVGGTAAWCVLAGLTVGLLLLGMLVPELSTKAAGKPQVLGQVFGTNPDQAPTSTTEPAPSAPPQTQQLTPATTAPPAAGTQSTPVAAAPATQAQSQTQTSSPPGTSTVLLASPDCGNGTATASVGSQTFPKSKTANTDYETDATATVHNGVDKAIQIDSLTIRLFYEDGGVQDVVFNNAVGNVLQPGVTNNYSVALNTGKRPVHTSALQSFSFHTNGHPECAGHSA